MYALILRQSKPGADGRGRNSKIFFAAEGLTIVKRAWAEPATSDRRLINKANG
jgi:hypothetical protein